MDLRGTDGSLVRAERHRASPPIAPTWLHDVKQRSITPPNQKSRPVAPGGFLVQAAVAYARSAIQSNISRRRRLVLLDSQAHRRAPPGSLSARSVPLSHAVAPSLPQWLQRIRGPNEGTGTSSGHASTFISAW